jgi:hypothetical protein
VADAGGGAAGDELGDELLVDGDLVEAADGGEAARPGGGGLL